MFIRLFNFYRLIFIAKEKRDSRTDRRSVLLTSLLKIYSFILLFILKRGNVEPHFVRSYLLLS